MARGRLVHESRLLGRDEVAVALAFLHHIGHDPAAVKTLTLTAGLLGEGLTATVEYAADPDDQVEQARRARRLLTA